MTLNLTEVNNLKNILHKEEVEVANVAWRYLQSSKDEVSDHYGCTAHLHEYDWTLLINWVAKTAD